MKYRCIISILFCILFLVPVTLLKDHSIATINLEINEQKAATKSALIDEAADFADDLRPVKKLEIILQEIDQKLGLVASGSADLSFTTGTDPGLINKDFISKFRHILLTDYGIRPLCVFAVDCDFRNFYSWYSKNECSNLANEVRSLIPKILLTGSVDNSQLKSFLHNKFFFANYDRIIHQIRIKSSKKYIRNETSKNPSDINLYCMTTDFSPTYYDTISNRTCREFSTRKFNSTSLFVYKNQIINKDAYAGKYIAMFTNNHFNYSDSIALEKQKTNHKYQRRFWTCADKFSGKFIESSNRVIYVSPLPPSLLISSKGNLSKKKLIVFTDQLSITQNLRTYKSTFEFIYKLIVLILITIVCRYLLFGFAFKNTIKRKIIYIISIMLLLPYASLGYFSNFILLLTDKSEKKQLQVEAKSQLFEFTSIIKDTQLRSIIAGIELKKDLLPLISNIDWDKGYPIIPRLEKHNFEVLLCNKIGEAHSLGCSGKGTLHPIREAKLIDLLNKFGVLDNSSPLSKKKLKYAMFAAGFAGTFDQNDSNIFASELNLTEDIAALSGRRLMLLLLLPNSKTGKKIEALALILLKDSHLYLDNFSKLSPNPAIMLTRISDRFTTQIAVALRSAIGAVDFKTIPSYLKLSNPLAKTLSKTMKNNNAGTLANPFDMKNSATAWTINNNKSVGIVAITQLHKNFLSKLSFRIFPFVLLIISLLSIFLLSDLISEMLATPLLSFVKAIELIKNENYKTNITMSSKDEFSILGNALNMMTTGLLQRNKMKRFVSDRLFKKVENSAAIQKPEKAKLVVLSSDIRSFTALSEKNAPEEIVNLLNDYFTEMEKAITENSGIIEKFIGDALIAIFYQDDNFNENCKNAVKAALKMRIALSDLNHKRSAQGKFNIENGIGIASGEAIAGVIASDSGRSEFTVFGEITSSADKLEAMTKFARFTKIAVCSQTQIELHNLYNFEVIKNIKNENIGYEVVNAK